MAERTIDRRAHRRPPRRRRGPAARRARSRLGARHRLSDDRHRLAHDEPHVVADVAAPRIPSDVLSPVPRHRLTRRTVAPDASVKMAGVLRVPLHSGSRLPLVTVPDDAVLLAPPPPLEPARRRPRSRRRGASLPALRAGALGRRAARRSRDRRRRSRRRLPLPARRARPAPRRPRRRPRRARAARRAARAASPCSSPAASAVARADASSSVLLRPRPRARASAAQIVVHDCEAEDLRHARARPDSVHRVNPVLVETDLVVTVGAGETVLHGGAGALVDACAPGTIRSAGAVSLLEAATRVRWRLASALESAARPEKCPSWGSRSCSTTRGSRASTAATRRTATSVARSPLAVPPPARTPRRRSSGDASSPGSRVSCGRSRSSPGRRASRTPRRSSAASTVRSIEIVAALRHDRRAAAVGGARSCRVAPLNPVSAAALGLGHVAAPLARPPAPRRGRDDRAPPPASARVTGDGPRRRTVRSSPRYAQRDGRRLRRGRGSRRARPAGAVGRTGAGPRRTRGSRSPTGRRAPPMLERAGRVIVAGCRDAGAARALGLVPSHNARRALDMARGARRRGRARPASCSAPPYPALVVTEPDDAGGAA